MTYILDESCRTIRIVDKKMLQLQTLFQVIQIEVFGKFHVFFTSEPLPNPKIVLLSTDGFGWHGISERKRRDNVLSSFVRNRGNT